MKVIVICYVFALVLPIQGGARADGEPEKAPWRKLKHLSWSINELVTTANLIVEARLERLDKPLSFGYRTLGLSIDTTISGAAPGAPTYLIAPPLALERTLSPTLLFLFTGPKYLLFLVHDANTAKAAAELETDPDNVFSVFGRWRGAIVLDGVSPEVCNRLLEQRGLLPPELRRDAKASEDSGRTTIETVQDMVAYGQPVPKGDWDASAKQKAALTRLKTSKHPWAGEFIRGLAKTAPEQKRERSGVQDPTAPDR